eukprot:2529631-Alexandrium_andersonii.AAC.1
MRPRPLSAAGGKRAKFDERLELAVTLKASTVNTQRDRALRKASDLLKDSGNVDTNWKERTIKVNGTVAFAQES